MNARVAVLTTVAAVVTLAGCGENWWSTMPTTPGGGDPAPPQVQIEAPVAGQRVATQDSVLVRVRVSDTDAIASLELSGFAIRRDESAGTAVKVERYDPVQINFAPLEVTDTVLSQYMVATPDSLSDDSVYVVARATDAEGSSAADTVVIAIDGPAGAEPLAFVRLQRAGGNRYVRADQRPRRGRGIDGSGFTNIDVVDSFHFRSLARIFMRDAVTGPMRAIETAGGLIIHAVTDQGIVMLEVLADDL